METPKPPAGGKTLLIVEDAVLTAMALRDALEDAGYKVLDLTSRYAEATAVATECKPDMALVNIELQGREDGIELAKAFKALGLPVLFISGHSVRARTSETGAMGSLPKPYSTVDMVQAVDYFLACLAGDPSRPRPHGLEVFDNAPRGLLPDVA
jgi:DNA-binding response OmpR family regulator